MNTFRKGQEAFNTVSGQCGSIVGVWTNIGGQTVFNVRVNGFAASWNIAETDLFSHEDTPRSPIGGGNPELTITDDQWAEVERYLDDWRAFIQRLPVTECEPDECEDSEAVQRVDECEDDWSWMC